MPRAIDIFFGFSQIAVNGVLPSEEVMWRNLFRQVILADELGFGTAWIGGAHLSLAEHQRTHPKPALPFFRGEVCLNTEIVQLAAALMAQTRHIAVGSALQTILPNGGPIAHAENLRTFLALQAHAPWRGRRLRYGFGAGRFDFVLQAHGIRPRSETERAAWPVIKGLLLREATEIFLRLARGETLATSDLPPRFLNRAAFRSDADWTAVLHAHGTTTDQIEVRPFWQFDRLQLVPTQASLESVDFYLGTTDRALAAAANRITPCRVFNLSNTPAEVIETTHRHMAQCYHPAGGGWQRGYLPRTVIIVVDADPKLTPAGQRAAAAARADAAVRAWQTAMEGTIDPAKLRDGMSNVIHGNPEDVAHEIDRRFHPEDTVMAWFDFNDHDTHRVEGMMHDFHAQVLPRLRELEARS